MTLADVSRWALAGLGGNPGGDRGEFAGLVARASRM